ncbi:MAG: DUF6049 family protein [Actinomycetota bacterium]|nr:DUF6049 family protein [Actinomycetota bacterium]
MLLARRIGLVLAATGAVFGASAFTSAPGTQAQESTTSVPSAPRLPVGLSLVSQTTWVPLRQTFTMKLHIDDPALAASPGAAIAIRIHQSTTSRSGFDEVIADQNLGGTLYVPNQISVASLHPDRHRDVSIEFGLPGSGMRPTIAINRPGVYPVEVQLVNTGVASGSFVTWLVAVDARASKPIEEKLSVSFVWQAVADPITLPDGTDDPNVVAEMKPGGRLDRIATLLARASGLRVSLAIGPETAEAWKRLGRRNPAVAASFARVRAAALRSTTQILPTTYVPIDAAALEAAGLGGYLTGEYAEGTNALRAALGASPPTSAQSAFIDPAPTNDTAVNALRQMLIDRVAVRDEALIPVNHPFSPSQAFVLETTGGASRAVATAPFVEDLFNGSDSSALRAERVIAALAEVAYETPSIPRGIVIAPPARWTPDLNTMAIVVAAVRSLPLIQAATLDNLLATISNEQALGTGVQRRLVPAVPAPIPVDADEYQSAANELSAFRDVVGARDPVVVQGEAALLTTLSTSISRERAHAELAKIDQAVHAFTAGVTADEKRITLTSRRAAVPLSFENNLKPARDVTVRVHLESAKMLFPDGADQSVTLTPGSNTIRFNVEARASGTFPMTISVTSQNGRLAFGAPVRVTVRSAVFGGWAVGVTVAALVFLAGWWANHLRRTRRSRRLANSPTNSPAPAT